MRASIISSILIATVVTAQQGAWQQCGGIGWTGGTSCISGWVCKYSNPYYSQCLQGSSPAPSSSAVSSGGGGGGSSNGGSGGIKATFTEYGSGDSNGSPNCATTVNACGTPQPGYTAALSQAQFGAGPGQGAGPACGKCYQITIDTDLNGNPVPQRTITVKINNLCPINGNPICNTPNQYGGQIHFDLCKDSGAAGAFFTSSGAGIGTAKQVSC